MQRKPLMLWGAALLSAVIVLEVTVQKDAPLNARIGGVRKQEHGNSNAAGVLMSKRGEHTSPKPSGDVGVDKSISR